MKPSSERHFAGSVAISYEKQDEVLKKIHRNGVHKYQAYLQAGRSITGLLPLELEFDQVRYTP
jgi:hypothetical protein